MDRKNIVAYVARSQQTARMPRTASLHRADGGDLQSSSSRGWRRSKRARANRRTHVPQLRPLPRQEQLALTPEATLRSLACAPEEERQKMWEYYRWQPRALRVLQQGDKVSKAAPKVVRCPVWSSVGMGQVRLTSPRAANHCQEPIGVNLPHRRPSNSPRQ